MFIRISALLLVSQLAVPAADGVPEFNLKPTCSAAAMAGAGLNADSELCMRKEEEARNDLRSRWSDFPATDRSRCVGSTGMGGVPSYVELLTCLEMAKAARDLPKDDLSRSTVGSGLR